MTTNPPEADLLLTNGRVDPADPRPTSVAIRGGLIQAIAPDADLAAAAGPATTTVDLGGRRVIPGLIDSHAHVLRGGMTWERELEWGEVGSLAEGLALISARAAAAPAGEWIAVVGGWHPGQFAERRAPERADLDRAAPDHPCFVQRLYDDAVLNTAALAACGLFDGAAPDGVEVERDVAGAPTGRVRGLAAFRWVAGAMGAASGDEQRRSLRAFGDHLAGFGITGAIDPGGFGFGFDQYGPLFDLWRADELGLRLRLFLCATRQGEELDEIDELTRVLPRDFGDDLLRVTGIGELVVSGCHDMEGLAPVDFDRDSRDRLLAVSRLVANRGWPMHVHTILDSSIAAVLDAWEAVDADHRVGPLGFTLAHVEDMSVASLGRARALGLKLAVQNRLMLRAADTARAWGAERVEQSPPLRAFVDAGFAIGAGTDGTRVTPINPWRSLWWFVTGRALEGGPRRGAAHRLDRALALRLYSEGSAALSGEAGRRGRLVPGQLADLAVLDRDYFTVGEDEIPAIRSALTVVGGRPTHVADGLCWPGS